MWGQTYRSLTWQHSHTKQALQALDKRIPSSSRSLKNQIHHKFQTKVTRAHPASPGGKPFSSVSHCVLSWALTHVRDGVQHACLDSDKSPQSSRGLTVISASSGCHWSAALPVTQGMMITNNIKNTAQHFLPIDKGLLVSWEIPKRFSLVMTTCQKESPKIKLVPVYFVFREGIIFISLSNYLPTYHVVFLHVYKICILWRMPIGERN